MAAAVSSVGLKRFDVFLSYRGMDTRRNFTSHLHASFNQKGITTFMDTVLDRGEEITAAILKAIEESDVSVVVFSKNYASSPWCLDELVKIIECMKTHGQKVLPVFYDVDPADVEKQTASFGDAFAEYEKSFKDSMAKVQKWRHALTEAAHLSGWDSRNTSSDSKLVEVIVTDIMKIIGDLSSCDFEELVGIETQIEKIESLLCIGVEDVRIIGIWGMGGIGKTTIARVVFTKYASHFEGSCFLENIRESSSTRQGLASKCDELVNRLLNNGTSYSSSKFLLSRLHSKKVFIVVDDVDDLDQLESLVGKNCWFGAGSRIIVTSRDKQVLQNKVDKIYEVKFLTLQEALQLFSLFAFKTNQPRPDFIELSNRVLSYAEGIPLALKVLGLFLYGRSKHEWGSALDRLDKTPNQQIQKVLRISYDGLDHDEQQIFLDVACFLKGWSVYYVTKILDACGYSSLISLRVLADKALIIIRDSRVEMHDVLREMGRQIVRQESHKDPGKRSRLWAPEDIQRILIENTGAEAVEGMFLDQSKISWCSVDSKVFYKTKGLKLLSIYNNNYGNLIFPQGLEYLPNQLRFLHWDYFPLKSLPMNFRAENLVLLNISHSPVEQLWAGVQNLASLTVIELRYCRHLTEMPDLSRAQNLLTIDCQGCINLRKVSPSIAYLSKLQNLYLQHCEKIKSVPSTKPLRSFSCLDLTGCSRLDEFPELSSNIKVLNLTGTSIEKSFASMKFLSMLDNPPSKVCQFDISVEFSDCGKCIYVSEISNCTLFLSFSKLNLSGKDVESMPTSVEENKIGEVRDADIPEQVPSSTEIGIKRLQYGDSIWYQPLHGLKFYHTLKMDQETRAGIINLLLKRIKLLTGAGLSSRKKHYSGQLIGDYPSKRSSVTIQLPPNWFSSTFNAFRIIAWLGFKDRNEREIDEFLCIRWRCLFKTKCGKTAVASAVNQYMPPQYSVDLDCLVYNDGHNSLIMDETWFSSYSVDEATFEAFIEHSSSRPCYIVNKVLVQLIYYGDEHGNPTIFRPCCQPCNIQRALIMFNRYNEKAKSHDYFVDTKEEDENMKTPLQAKKKQSRRRKKSRRKKLQNNEKTDRYINVRELKWFKPFWTFRHLHTKSMKKRAQFSSPRNKEHHFQYPCINSMDTTSIVCVISTQFTHGLSAILLSNFLHLLAD